MKKIEKANKAEYTPGISCPGDTDRASRRGDAPKKNVSHSSEATGGT
jgi:hypothetical protein